MGNRLRRTSLLPATAGTPEVAPVAEPYAFASLSPDLLLRVARDTGRGDDAGDLLCRKGQASASRWRSYDHKDVFEPAQAATAPPSDAEEMGSWQKYDGAPPAPKGSAKTVSDDELPTSWFKYETKPIASLLGSIEHRRARSQVALVESAAPTAPAAVETALEPDCWTAPVAPEPTLVAEVPAIEAKPASAAEIEAVAPAPVADSAFMAAPVAETAPAVELAAATVPELPLPEIASPDLAATVAEDDEPGFPTTAAPVPAELERSEAAVPSEDPTSALAPSDEQGPALTEEGAPEALVIAIDEPQSDEPATVPGVTEIAHPTSETVQEEPSVASVAPAPSSDTAPLPQQEPAAATAEPANAGRAPGKKAMLARLAEVLEQALSAKRTPAVDAAPTIVSIDEPLSVATAQETLVEVVVPQDDHDHGTEIKTGADISIEAVAVARVEPETIEPVVDERPIEPEAPPTASPEPDVELPAPPLDTTEIGDSPAIVEAESSEVSLPVPPVDVTDELVAPADELSRADGHETGTGAPVLAAAETTLAADPVDPTQQHAPQPDLAPEVAEVKTPDRVRKATLARLAEMLERALSARSASSAVEPTPPEPTPVVASPITEDVASPAAEAQIPPAAPLPVEPVAVEAPLALTEPAEFSEPALVVDDVTASEPADVTNAQTVANFRSSEASALETDLNLESVPETPPPDQQIHIEQLHDPETAAAYEALQDETAATLALSDEVAGPAADSVDLTTPDGQAPTAASTLGDGAATADMSTEPTLEAVAVPVAPEMQPEGHDSAITWAGAEAATLDGVSTPVEEAPTQTIATALDAETEPPDGAHNESEPVRAPVPALDAISVAPEPAMPESEISEAVDASVLAARTPTTEAPIIAVADVRAEEIVDAVAPLETTPPEQAHEVSDPVSAPTPTRDAPPVAPERALPEPEISDAVAAPALAASGQTIETPEPIVVAPEATADPVVDAAAPIEIAPREQENDAAEPVPAPAPPLDAAPIAQEPSAPEPGISEAVHLPALAAPIPTIETPEPIIDVAEISAEPIVDVGAAAETAAVETSPEPAAVAPPPLTPAQQEKAERQALTDDLADVIHNVLSTTQFASRAMKPKRYAEDEPQADEPELIDLADELAASLPHPATIPPRFGRTERGIAFASAAMMLAAGYFAFSLWHDPGSPAARAAAPAPPIAVAAPRSEDWGERARDMTRGLNSIAVARDAPNAQVPGPAANAGTRPQGPESAQ